MTNERIQAMKAIIKTAPSGAAPNGGSVSAGEALAGSVHACLASARRS